jgi:hypothetical protein
VAARRKFDFDDALDVATRGKPNPGSRITRLDQEPIRSWIEKCHARQRAGRITWRESLNLINAACKAEGLPPLQCSHNVLGAFALRRFGSGVKAEG